MTSNKKPNIIEESKTAAEMAADALVDAGIVKKEDMDRAIEIIHEEILVRRTIESL